MKKLFPEYYPLTKDEKIKIWKNGIFILDANALLDLYRYSESASQELLTILEKFKSKLWLPHQVALEFLKNRMKVIYEQKLAYEAVCGAIDTQSESFIRGIKGGMVTRHPFINKKEIIRKIKGYTEKTKRNIKKMEENHPQLDSDDTILKKIDKLFAKKVGKPYKTEKLKQIYLEGKRRYAQEIPPGFMDAIKDQEDKSGKRKYGDLIIWKQTLDHAKKIKKPIVFITGEQKEDWWEIVKGRKIGPRFELIKEAKETAQVEFCIYSINQFIIFAKAEGIDIQKDTLNEVRMSEQDQEVVSSIITSDLDLISTPQIEKGPSDIGKNHDETESEIGNNEEEVLVGKSAKNLKEGDKK